MSNEIGKAIAIRELKRFGFHVDEVPVDRGQTADLLVSDKESKYLIEVKDKSESDSLATEMAESFKRGELHESSSPLAYNNRISGVLRKAQKQLDDTAKEAGTFQLIWFHATGIDADLKYRQAFATFYGQVYLRAPYGQTAPDFGCFYWDYSDSFKMPTIEALILTDKNQLQFCVNEYSIRNAEFRQTKLFRILAEVDGIIDPMEWQAKGLVIALRSEIPRRNDFEIGKALEKQTGILYSATRLDRHTFTAGRQNNE
jgi:hypothetical protein